MVDVAGGAQGERQLGHGEGSGRSERRAHGGGEIGDLVIADRQHVEQQTVVVEVAEHRGRAAPQPPGELADAVGARWQGDGDALDLGDRQRPAPARATESTTSPAPIASHRRAARRPSVSRDCVRSASVGTRSITVWGSR